MTVIAVYLTALAPGCAALSLGDRRRFRDFPGRTLDQALRATLRRVGRAPAEVTAGLYGDDPALLVPVPDQPRPYPVALVWNGATPDDLAAALGRLTAQGWRPPAAGPSQPQQGTPA